MTTGSREKLYQQWNGGDHFSPRRFVTKDALQRVIEKSNFGPNDFANLQNIEIVAPEGEVAVLGPSDHNNSMTICFLPYQIEAYSPFVAERAIINGLARACVVNNGTHKNEVE